VKADAAHRALASHRQTIYGSGAMEPFQIDASIDLRKALNILNST
jgi:hypothetical protein